MKTHPAMSLPDAVPMCASAQFPVCVPCKYIFHINLPVMSIVFGSTDTSTEVGDDDEEEEEDGDEGVVGEGYHPEVDGAAAVHAPRAFPQGRLVRQSLLCHMILYPAGWASFSGHTFCQSAACFRTFICDSLNVIQY